jgi:hypothetical protein
VGRLVATGLLSLATTAFLVVYIVMDAQGSAVPDAVLVPFGILALLSAVVFGWWGKVTGQGWLWIAGFFLSLPTFIYLVVWLQRRGAFY